MEEQSPRRKRLTGVQQMILDQVDSATAHAQQYSQTPWVMIQARVKIRWLELIQRCIQASWDLSAHHPQSDPFMVYAILATRYFSHHQAVQVLVAIGRYG